MCAFFLFFVSLLPITNIFNTASASDAVKSDLCICALAPQSKNSSYQSFCKKLSLAGLAVVFGCVSPSSHVNQVDHCGCSDVAVDDWYDWKQENEPWSSSVQNGNESNAEKDEWFAGNDTRYSEIQKIAETFVRTTGFRLEEELPVLLSDTKQRKLYTLDDVVHQSKQIAPQKKLAIVLIKTHACDNNSKVCLKSLDRITDVANIFIHQNFTVFHSRFYSDAQQLPDNESSEKAIRQEWQKFNFGPEIFVIDVEHSIILGRARMGDRVGVEAFSNNFVESYIAIRNKILDMPGVSALLAQPNEQCDNIKLLNELKEAMKQAEKFPSESYGDLLKKVDTQARAVFSLPE